MDTWSLLQILNFISTTVDVNSIIDKFVYETTYLDFSVDLSESVYLVSTTLTGNYITASLQDAIDNISNLGTIYICSTYTGDTTITISKNLNIYGGMVIDGNTGSVFRKLNITKGNSHIKELVTLSSLGAWETTEEHYTTLSNTAGRIIIPYPDTIIQGITFYNASNKTLSDPAATITNGNTGLGGAVLCSAAASSTTLNSIFNYCTFDSNTAVSGGALYIYNNSAPAFNNCIFKNNTADEGSDIVLRDCTGPTFDNCTADGDIVIDYGTSATFTDCTLNNVYLNNRGARTPTGVFFNDSTISGALTLFNSACTAENSTFNTINTVYNSTLTLVNSTYTTYTDTALGNPYDGLFIDLDLDPDTITMNYTTGTNYEVILVGSLDTTYTNFTSLKEAVENSSDGTITLIAGGVFYEGGIIIEKNIEIYGGFSISELEDYSGNVDSLTKTPIASKKGNYYRQCIHSFICYIF